MRTLLTTTAAIAMLAIAPLHAQTTTPSTNDGAMQQRGTTTGGAMQGADGMSAESLQSYDEMDDFSGTITGGYEADEIMGADVVNQDGDSLGEVEDLGVDASGNVTHVLVDVSDFLSLEDHVIALDLNELSRGEGDAADDEFVVNQSEDQLESMTRYELEDNRWTISRDE